MSAISDKLAALPKVGIDLGEPLSDEEDLPDGGARQPFDNGGLYFHPRLGEAFLCAFDLLQEYANQGQQDGALGYPVADSAVDPDVDGGLIGVFEGGALRFDPAVGTVAEFADMVSCPQIVVKIVESLPVTLEQGVEISLEDFAAMLGLASDDPFVFALEELLPDLTFRRLYDGASPVELAKLVAEAQKLSPDYVPAAFEQFVSINCPEDLDPAPLADALLAFPDIVEIAYVAPVPEDATVIGTGNPKFAAQRHLTAMNVPAAWRRNADGSGTNYIDIELGWLPDHEDLPLLTLLGGQNLLSSFGHGTAVRGVIQAIDNLTGVVGIAPETNGRFIGFFSRTRRGTRQELAFESAISLAITKLAQGDVLLLESETIIDFNGARTGVPAELTIGTYNIIALATGRGIIVVEAAGNSALDMDLFRDDAGQAVLSRSGPGARADSNAIVVGGCLPNNTRWIDPAHPTTGSNFGSRVDCCGWAEQVATCGQFNPPFRRDAYLAGPAPTFFSGTSSAAAIIAGICLLVEQLSPTRLRSDQCRAILANPANGTAIPGVGPLPDMARIIANHFP